MRTGNNYSGARWAFSSRPRSMWRKVEAGHYCSRDGRFEVQRLAAFEDEGEGDCGVPPMEWFLYDQGDMIDAYGTLREAKAMAEKRRV